MTPATRALSKRDLMAGLARVGLKQGDHVLVHAALSSFGWVRGGADALIDGLLETVSAEGTILFPTFGSGDEVFDPEKSETGLGAVPRAFWKRKGAARSRHPLASVAAIGNRAAWFVAGHENARTAHGEGTPYHKLYQVGGKVLLLGVDQDRSTFLHTAEELGRLPYLKPKTATYVDAAGKRRRKTWQFFPGPHRNFIGMQAWLEERGLTRKTTIGSCVAQIMPCRALLDALLRRLKDEPGLFISDNPNLPDGIWQRADILRARWRQCSFRIAVDSRWAGQYAEEMIDGLADVGLDLVMLSFLNDTPWHQVPEARRKWVLRGLRMAKLGVAGLRLPVLVPCEAAALLKEAGTDTLVVPSTCRLEGIEELTGQGVQVLVENLGIGGRPLSHVMENMHGRRGTRDVKLAFNPLAFAEVGEHPFLESYQTALRRHIRLLVVHDGLATGRRTLLEEGLAEVKELVSILRSKGFDGLCVLEGAAGWDLPAVADAFLAMLEETGVCPPGLST